MQKLITCALLLLVAAGCCWRRSRVPGEYATLATDPRRDTEAARKHNDGASRLLESGKLDQAEKELKAALAADTFFGPAHNNLGRVYYGQKRFYLAAWEFQYAIKLIPDRAEPRNNLAMVFEAVGKQTDAIKYYEEALAVSPDNIQVIGNLARALVRTNHKDEKTRQLLSEIVIKDSRPEWVAWAREYLALMGQPKPEITRPGKNE